MDLWIAFVAYGSLPLMILAMIWWHETRLPPKSPPRGTEAYDREFSRTRRIALARDGHRCRTCGTTAPLDVHHIVPRAQGGSNDPTNLITLCKEHHRLVHRR